MANCGFQDWQNRTSDSFTQWKEEYLHRTFCDMLIGDCDIHDGNTVLSIYQNKLRSEIESLENNIDHLKGLLAKHQNKWGVRKI